MTTIQDIIDRSFQEEPTLLSVSPSGEKLLWLTTTVSQGDGSATSDGWYMELLSVNDANGASPVSRLENADEIVRQWIHAVGDLPGLHVDRVGAGSVIGQCESCDYWLSDSDCRNADEHENGCEMVRDAS